MARQGLGFHHEKKTADMDSGQSSAEKGRGVGRGKEKQSPGHKMPASRFFVDWIIPQ